MGTKSYSPMPWSAKNVADTSPSFVTKCGRGALTGKKQDDYKFLTPSLRDVARTGPYMHDGSINSLYYVTIHYLKSVPTSGPGGIALDVEAQLGLSFSDVDRFTAFFKSLSGTLPKVKTPKIP